jgi:hypothetical protein
MSSIAARLLLFPAEAADRARVVYMPDTAWPEKRTTRQTHPGTDLTPRFWCHLVKLRHVIDDSLTLAFPVPT